MGNKARPEEAGRAVSGAAGPPRADRAGNAARQTSARRSGCRQRGGRRDGPRGGVGAAGGARPGREGGSGGGVPGAALGRAPTPARALSRYLPAGKLRAPPGLSRPPASGARKRPHIAGGRASGPGAPGSPRPSSPAFASCFFAAETCAEPGPRRHRREGGLVNGRSATSRERRGRIRRGAGGGGCHGRAGWAEARAGEAAAPRGRRLGSRLSPRSAAPREVAAAAFSAPSARGAGARAGPGAGPGGGGAEGVRRAGRGLPGAGPAGGGASGADGGGRRAGAGPAGGSRWFLRLLGSARGE